MDKEAVNLFKAIHELKIDVPVMRYEMKGDKIILHLYGGQVLEWQPGPERPAAAPRKPAALKTRKKK